MAKEIKSIHDLGTTTDKSSSHRYLEIYEGFFEPIRSKVKNVLEIGIYHGDSHRLWRDYFPNATVYGIEYAPDHVRLGDLTGIKPFWMDAYTEEAIEMLKDVQFDVIIDDGPHNLSSMQFCVANYTKLLTPNGILVIEDISTPDWFPEISSQVPPEHQRWMFGIDRRMATIESFYKDDLMFVIDRRFARD